MRVLVFFIVCMLAITSCNQLNDLQPVDPQTVPSNVIRRVKEHFPLAENLVFKPLVEKQVWEVKFDENAKRFVSLVDSTKMWETLRFNPDYLPSEMTSLLANSALKGGSFDSNMEDIGFYNTQNSRNKVIYKLHGTDYVFDWLYVDKRVAGAMLQQSLYMIGTPDINMLPAKIQQFIASDETLTFRHIEVRIQLNYEKLYEVQVDYKLGARNIAIYTLFDSNGDLKWFSNGFNEPQSGTVPRNFDQMPDAIQQYLDASPELEGFVNQPIAGYQWMGEYKGLTCYTIKFRHETEPLECEFRFDQSGNLIYKMYYFLG